MRVCCFALQVEEVGSQDVVCRANNEADLDGLLTVFHCERSSTSLANVQNDLPILAESDREAVASLGADFDIDFVSLSYVRGPEDLQAARDQLDSMGLSTTKVGFGYDTKFFLHLKIHGKHAESVLVEYAHVYGCPYIVSPCPTTSHDSLLMPSSVHLL